MEDEFYSLFNKISPRSHFLQKNAGEKYYSKYFLKDTFMQTNSKKEFGIFLEAWLDFK